ncbi:MAG: AlpA family transcriptional regulator [Polyangia bacterium]
MTATNEPQAARILRRRQVEALIGLRRSAIYAAVRAGTFPRPIHLGPRSVGWLEHEVNGWIAERVAESRQGSVVETKP